jgi:hypothetical protein
VLDHREKEGLLDKSKAWAMEVYKGRILLKLRRGRMYGWQRVKLGSSRAITRPPTKKPRVEIHTRTRTHE